MQETLESQHIYSTDALGCRELRGWYLAGAAIGLLEPLVNGFLKSVAIPYFNKKFPGFLADCQGFPISDFVITHANGFLGVGLDITPQQQELNAPQPLPAPRSERMGQNEIVGSAAAPPRIAQAHLTPVPRQPLGSQGLE